MHDFTKSLADYVARVSADSYKAFYYRKAKCNLTRVLRSKAIIFPAVKYGNIFQIFAGLINNEYGSKAILQIFFRIDSEPERRTVAVPDSRLV